MDSSKNFAIYAALRFLKDQEGADGVDSSQVSAAITTLSNSFGVNLESAEDFKMYSTSPTTLQTLLEKGMESTGTLTYEKNVESCSGQKFNVFVDSVKKKGVYNDLDEDTIDYMNVHAKVVAKYKEKLSKGGSSTSATASTASTAPKEKKVVTVAMEKAAEEKKNQGNNALQKQNFNAAVRLYTEAIDICPEGANSHIYLSNRAAAH